MGMKHITMKTGKDKILKMFKDAEGGIVNLKTEKGFIYAAGGILNKLEGFDHYISIKGKWEKIEYNYTPIKLETRP